MKKQMQTKQMTIRLSDDLDEQINRIAATIHMPRTTVIVLGVRRLGVWVADALRQDVPEGQRAVAAADEQAMRGAPSMPSSAIMMALLDAMDLATIQSLARELRMAVTTTEGGKRRLRREELAEALRARLADPQQEAVRQLVWVWLREHVVAPYERDAGE
jgi:predicted transcriptional regulator